MYVLMLIIGIFVLGSVVGIAIGLSLNKPPKPAGVKVIIKEVPIGQSDIEKEKIENLEKIKKFASENAQITNTQICQLLNISDSTAVRYLDELEKQFYLKQIGTTGVDTYYEKII